MLLARSAAWGFAAGVAGAAAPGIARAHDGSTGGGSLTDFLTAWPFDAAATAGVVALGVAYAVGYRRLRAGAPRFRFSRWRPAAFGAGVAALALALLSPIEAYADDLLTAHMLQHALIVMVAAPLLALGAPGTLALRAASPRMRARVVRPLLLGAASRWATRPPVTWLILAAVVWVWHLPELYEAAVQHESLHALEHASFLAVAFLFWWVVLGVDATPRRAAYPARLGLVFAALVQALLLAFLIAGLDAPAYDAYVTAAAGRDWGPSALQDQRIGAGYVWVAGGMAFVVALFALVASWMNASERAELRRESLRRRVGQAAHGG